MSELTMKQLEQDTNKNKRGWWSISMQLSLNGEKVYFEDLSEVSQEHIAEMIKQGYLQGELNEEE